MARAARTWDAPSATRVHSHAQEGQAQPGGTPRCHRVTAARTNTVTLTTIAWPSIFVAAPAPLEARVQ